MIPCLVVVGCAPNGNVVLTAYTSFSITFRKSQLPSLVPRPGQTGPENEATSYSGGSRNFERGVRWHIHAAPPTAVRRAAF